MGTIDVKIPKLRHGSFFPSLAFAAPLSSKTLPHHRCSEVLPQGAPTCRMNDLVICGITNLSTSQVSDMAKDFRTRPLDTSQVLIASRAMR
ncbi:transposase [Corynebacterium mayonis]|uniref:transposase n=1 Tax=Corynebacterium mayonis TaxID=3062461 RepID=UPI0031409991